MQQLKIIRRFDCFLISIVNPTQIGSNNEREVQNLSEGIDKVSSTQKVLNIYFLSNLASLEIHTTKYLRVP